MEKDIFSGLRMFQRYVVFPNKVKAFVFFMTLLEVISSAAALALFVAAFRSIAIAVVSGHLVLVAYLHRHLVDTAPGCQACLNENSSMKKFCIWLLIILGYTLTLSPLNLLAVF